MCSEMNFAGDRGSGVRLCGKERAMSDGPECDGECWWLYTYKPTSLLAKEEEAAFKW